MNCHCSICLSVAKTYCYSDCRRRRCCICFKRQLKRPFVFFANTHSVYERPFDTCAWKFQLWNNCPVLLLRHHRGLWLVSFFYTFLLQRCLHVHVYLFLAAIVKYLFVSGIRVLSNSSYYGMQTCCLLLDFDVFWKCFNEKWISWG